MYNRLVSYQADQKGKKESYSYDAEGVRRSKTASEGEEEKEILFISDTSGELSRTLAETDEEGELLASYGWGDTLLSQTREGKTSTYLYDGQGNVRGLLDEKGNLTDTYAYNAYGELTEKTGETENHFLYTGEYYDGVSGLYYLRARYMSPETGTFISMDTWQGDLYEPVTLHKYLYANANPVKYKDPSGMFSLPECNIASAIGAELYQNQNVILGMSLLNGIGKSVMTGLCGGDAGDMTEAFLEGMIEGAAMGMLFCAAAAVLATSMLTVMMAHTTASSVVSIVLAIYSVSEGDYLNALVYGAVAVAGIIGVCRWWKVTYQVDYVGEKGIARFAGGSGNASVKDGLGDLDWTNTSRKGQTVLDHVQKHGSPNYQREMHGVFRGDVQTMIEDAWTNRVNAKVVSDNMGGTIYNIPYQNVGYNTGYKNFGQQMNYVTIVVQEGTSKVWTAFPSFGDYGMKMSY